MKKTVSLILAVIVMFSTVFSLTTFAADDGVFKDFKYTVNSDNSVTISGYTGNDTSVKIPDSIGGKSVESIGNSAFKGNYKLKSIEIPDTVKSIDDFAFNECTNLKEVTLPNSVKSIGKSAFFYCTRLENVNLSDGIESIGDGAFFGCGNLKSFEITDSVKSVGEYAFAKCTNLKSVTLGNGLKTISNQLFSGCESLEKIVIPEGVETIGRRAFINCQLLKDVTLPKSLRTIDENAFYGCSMSSVDVYATTIGENAFAFCSNLESITLSDNLVSIGDGAFQNTYFKNFEVPKNVKTIGKSALKTGLMENISVAEGNKYFTSENGVLFNKSKTEILDYPNYKEGTEYSIPNSVTKIGDYAFSNDYHELDSVVIPDGVVEIGEGAFKDFSMLKKIDLPKSLKKIGKEAFSGCMSVTEVSIPDGVTSIEDSTFASSGLKSIQFSDSVKSIGDKAFASLYDLENVTFSAGLESVSPTAFAECSGMKRYDVVAGNPYLTTVDGVLFSKDKTVLMAYPYGKTDKSYAVPEGTKSIADYAILNSSLESVTLPSSIESLGKFSVGYIDAYGSTTPTPKESFVIYNQSSNAVKNYCDENDIALFTAEPSQNIKSVSLESGKTAVFTISNAAADDVVYSTSDKTVADVDQNGTITANSQGITDIIASVGTKYFYCKVNVTSGEPKDSDYVYSGFDTKDFKPLFKYNYKPWEDSFYELNKDIPATRLDNPAIYCYSTSEYIQIMAVLVGGQYLDNTKQQMGDDYCQYFTIADDLSMELSRYHTSTDMLLYSGTNDASGITGKSSSLKDMKASIGSSYVDGGVVSTSIDHGVADHFGDGTYHTVLEIYAPSTAIDGSYISKMSEFSAEYELLLNKKIKYEVLDAGVRTTIFIPYSQEEPTTRTERYIKLRLVDDSKPTEPVTTAPETTVAPSTTVPSTTAPSTTIVPSQTSPTSSTKPVATNSVQSTTKPSSKSSASPVKTGQAPFAFGGIALVLIIAFAVYYYAKQRKKQ